MSTPLRVALIGAGSIARAHIRSAQQLTDKLVYVALCDASDDSLKQAGELFTTPVATHKDWRQMLANAGDTFDAVDICLPHHLHAPAILDAARAGKHILCEKPLCLNLDEADAIERAIDEAGVTFAASHNQLFIPAVIEAKRRITAGEIGELLWIRLQECFVAGRNFDNSWRADVATQGGGVLIDTGYHPTYILMHLAGFDVIEAKGVMARHKLTIEGEDTANVVLRFGSGATGEIFTSWALPMPIGTHRLHVIGTKGQLFGSTNALWIARDGEEAEQIELGSANDFAGSIEHFADSVINGTQPVHGVREARRVLEVILQASEGAAVGTAR